MHFRRTSNKRKVHAELKTKHVRRRIDETKASVKIEWVPAEIGFKSLRQDDLKNISRANVLLNPFHSALELAWMNIAVKGLRLEIRSWSQRKFNRIRKFLCDVAD